MGQSAAGLSRAYTYLLRSSMLGAGSGSGATPCAYALWNMRRAVEDSPHFAELPPVLLGVNVPFYPL